MEDLVDERVTPREGELVVVRGSLGAAGNGSAVEGSCGMRAAIPLVLESELDDVCYQVELDTRGLECVGDDSMVYCRNFPMGEEVAYTGEFWTSPPRTAFRAGLLHAKACTPSPEQLVPSVAPTPSAAASMATDVGAPPCVDPARSTPSASAEASPAPPPMAAHEGGGPRVCGARGGRLPDAEAAAAAHPGRCLAETGCGPGPRRDGRSKCPQGPVVSVADLVEGRVRPAEGEPVLLRGVVGRVPLSAVREAGCGVLRYSAPTLEATLAGACYQVELGRGGVLGCVADDSMVCCREPAIGEELVVLGLYHGSRDPSAFHATLDEGTPCVPRPEQW